MPPTQNTWITRLAFGGKCGPRLSLGEVFAASAFSLASSQDNASQPKPAPESRSNCRRESKFPVSVDINKLTSIKQRPAQRFEAVLIHQCRAVGQFARLRRPAHRQQERTLSPRASVAALFRQTLREGLRLPLDKRVIHQAQGLQSRRGGCSLR